MDVLFVIFLGFCIIEYLLLSTSGSVALLNSRFYLFTYNCSSGYCMICYIVAIFYCISLPKGVIVSVQVTYKS